MHIGALGCSVGYDKVRSITLGSSESLFDFDVVYMNPRSSIEGLFNYHISVLASAGFPQGTVANIRKVLENRISQFEAFLSSGRTLVLTPLFIPTIKSVNRAASESIDLNELFPWGTDNLKEDIGENVTASNISPYQTFFNAIKGRISYQARFTKPLGQPIFYIHNTKQVVACIEQRGKGTILYLPPPKPGPDDERIYFTALEALIKNLPKSVENESLPQWTNNATVVQENEAKINLDKLYEEQSALTGKISVAEQRHASITEMKRLFASNGADLEKAVKAVLVYLGFEFTTTEPNRDDLIGKFKNTPVVIEIKGHSKSAAESDATQLEKWVTEYYSNHKVEPKGILVVNTFRNIPLDQRTATDFPAQMLPYSEKRGHCLLTGLQLLGVYSAAVLGKCSNDELADKLLSTEGWLSEFRDWRQFVDFT